MATLYITEYNRLGCTERFDEIIMAPYAVPVTTQAIVITGSSNASAAFNTNTKFVFITTDATCSIAFSTGTATATTSNERLVQDAGRFYTVPAGGTVAVISNT